MRAFFGAAQYFIGRLDLLEPHRGLLVALLQIGMVFLGQAAVRGLGGGEIGVGFEVEHRQRAHLVAAAGAVAGAAPLPVLGLTERRGASALLGLAGGGLFGVEPGEIIPVAVIFGGVGEAEIPALLAVRRLGGGPVAGRIAAVAVASPDSRRLAALAVGTPAGKTPIVGSRRFGHKS